jgi:hypothetical protein
MVSVLLSTHTSATPLRTRAEPQLAPLPPVCPHGPPQLYSLNSHLTLSLSWFLMPMESVLIPLNCPQLPFQMQVTWSLPPVWSLSPVGRGNHGTFGSGRGGDVGGCTQDCLSCTQGGDTRAQTDIQRRVSRCQGPWG